MNNINFNFFELVYIIVNHGLGSRVLQKAKKHGVAGGTIFLSKGTVKSSLLNFLSLYDERKEIVVMGADQITTEQVLSKLNKEFKFEKPNHGIAFTINLNDIIGSRNYPSNDKKTERGAKESMYQVIISIVNRGDAENVIEAAQSAGSKGGTIINGRGSGINETTKLFNMDIEPEKEIVFILSKDNTTDNIVNAIKERLNIEEPGNGIIFIQDVNNTYGIFE